MMFPSVLHCLRKVRVHPFSEKCISSASRPKDCVAVVEELPSLNRNVLQYIVSFLQTHVLRYVRIGYPITALTVV